jgi:F0F1-type ATP synthase membrane subunit b/b'
MRGPSPARATATTDDPARLSGPVVLVRKVAAAPAPAAPARPPPKALPKAPPRPSAAAHLKRRAGPGGSAAKSETAVPTGAAGSAAPKSKPRAGKAPAAQDGAGAAPAAGPIAEAAGPAGGGGGAAAGVRLHMPEPPQGLSPASQARLKAVQGRTATAAAAKSELPPADAQVGAARQSVTPPEAERAAAAQAELIERVKAAPSPEIVKLCQHIKAAIKERRPTDQDALEAADPEKEAEAAGSGLNSAVTGETQKVQDNYGAVNDNPAAPPAAKAPDLPPAPDAKPAPAIGAAAARPDPVPAESVSLDKDAEAAREQSRSAGMDTPAASLVKSGPIAEARDAQADLDKTAQEGPAEILAKQEQALGKAETDMGALAAEALAALNMSRQGAVKGTGARQKGMVGSEESMRLAAGEQAQAVFSKAQSSVQALLKNLPQKAMEKWEQAKKLLVIRFKADLKAVQDRVDLRHSDLVLWVADKLTGLPDWAAEGYTRAENNFADGVIEKLLAISSEVNSIIKACDEIIANARKRIDEIFDALPESLRGWADQEKGKFGKQLDQLHDEAAAVRDNFNKDLKRQASEAVNEVRNEIAELRKKAGGLIGRIADAVQRFLDDPAKAILEALLELLGIPPAAFYAVVAKIKKAVKDIAADPLGFGENLLKGLGQGFSQFFDNFGSHMFKGFLTWLIGDLKGVQVPKDFSLKSIATFFLQLMGITWPNIRKILVDKIGAKNVALIEKVYDLISVLIDKGIGGIYEMIKEKLNPQALIDQVIQMAVDYMVEAIAKQVAVRLLLLFNPAGAIIQALEAIYRVLKWVFQNAARIFRLVETVVNGITDIIAGNVGGFAKAVENALGMLVAPVISFIADYFGLGDLPTVVAKKVESMQKWVLGMIGDAVDWIIAKGKAALAAMGLGKKDEKKPGDAAGGEIGETVEFTAAGEPHRLWIETNGDEATVMMASAEESLETFLDSEAVKARSKADKSKETANLVKQAKAELKKIKSDAAGVLKAMKQISQEQSGAAPAKGKSAATGSEVVSAEERALAETLTALLEAMEVEEPLGGIHKDLCKEATKAKYPRESHHVPAKTLGIAIGEFQANAAAALRRGGWRENTRAAVIATMMKKQSDIAYAASTEPADSLSAILISHASHKGEFGVHSREFAPVLVDIERQGAADRLLMCKTKAAKKIADETSSFISVNPQMPGWREFLADVQRQIADKKAVLDSTKGRGNKSVLQLILSEARAEMEVEEKASDAHLEAVLARINKLLGEAPRKGFQSGRATVARAMEMNMDGTPAGQAKALSEVEGKFETTWEPFTEELV